MSYKSDKERMKREASEYQGKVWFIIKITFIVFACLLVLFCVVFAMSTTWEEPAPADTVAPEIVGPTGNKVVGYVGEKPLYKQMVGVRDNMDDAPVIEVNNKSVNIDKEGEYKVYFRAKDKSGNVSEVYTLTYVVKSKQYSKDTLMALVAEKADELGITFEMTKKEQVIKIYSYVNNKKTIEFTNESNIPDIDRRNWEIDWVEEAIRAFDTEEGDCYTYYSLSKAFFEYFGIRNEGLQRSPESEEEGTHFWSIVEVEEGWYYYDATRLAGKFSDGTRNACLITQSKLDSYETSKGGKEFYLLDKKPGKLSETPID